MSRRSWSTNLPAWLRGFFHRPANNQPIISRRSALTIEGLEDRLAPATVTFQVVNTWNGGYQAQIQIGNDTTTPITNWKLDFDLGSKITSMWDGSLSSGTGNHYSVQNAGYNGTIAPGKSVSVGLVANGSPTVLPANYAINGVAIGSIPPTVTLPGLSMSGAAVTESGVNTTASFVVSLSKVATQPVKVNYATSNGTAKAGINYTAATGTLTFAAGETSKTIAVAVLGNLNTGVLPDLSFSLTLSAPSGATLTTAVATGTIRHVAPGALPQLSVNSATGSQGSSGGVTSATKGYFRTSGNQIIDAAGKSVRIAGINWYGLETGNYAPGGLGARSYQSMMNQMKQLGFNTIRLPFSSQLLNGGGPSGINYTLNPDLQGLSGMGVMDKIVSYAGQIGLRIILDHHHTTIYGSNSSGLWYTDSYPESAWIADWVKLAQRYAGNSTVVGADLFNEPALQATWGDGNTRTDWRLAAQRAGNAILAVNSNWLIIVEGIDKGPSGSYWWGGNLSSAGQYPVTLNVANRVVYSPHDYPADVYNQSWFSSPNYPNNLPDLWTRNWGYLYINNIAPVWLGEFGSKLDNPTSQLWYSTLVNYLKGNMGVNGGNVVKAGQQGVSWAYWAWNPESADVGGLLRGDWNTVISAKVDPLETIGFSFTAGGTIQPTPPTPVTFTVTLSAANTKPVTVTYATVNGTAKAGVDFTATSGTLTFVAGQTSATVTVPVLNNAAATTNRTFSLVLSSPSGAKIGTTTGSGIGTIVPAATSSSGTSGGTTGSTTGGTTGSVSANFAYKVTENWGTGFNGLVTITNTTSKAISNWTLEFDVPFDITELWSGTIINKQGNHYVVKPVSYNVIINPGSSVTIGFTGKGSGQGQPTGYKLIPGAS